jgi:hypothetical protein
MILNNHDPIRDVHGQTNDHHQSFPEMVHTSDLDRRIRCNDHFVSSLHDDENSGVVGPHGGDNTGNDYSAAPAGKSNIERC